MQPQTPPTQLTADSATDASLMRKLALDWVDALGILVSLYALVLVLQFAGVEEFPRIIAVVVVLGFPVARRRFLGTPVRTVSRSFSVLGLASTLLIVFGVLGGGFTLFAAMPPAKAQRTTPVEEPYVGLQMVAPAGASPEVRARIEEENRVYQERVQREERERRAREEQARQEQARRERMRILLVMGSVTVGMVALGGFLDRLRMRRDAAA